MRSLIMLLVSANFLQIFTNCATIRSTGDDGVGAVVSNGQECGPIGIRVLEDGGNAFDAAIAVLLCEGVTGPQSMGIGGGFLATIYVRKNKEQPVVSTLNARETAPANSSAEMFKGLSEIKGGHATAIPGEIKGYWELKQQYGNHNYNWSQIFKHAIDLCEKGYKVDSFLARILKEYENRINETESLKEIFVNSTTKRVYKEGDILTRPKLAETLRNISKGGADEFYGGVTGQNFIDDVRSMGGILTMDDLRNYRTVTKDAIRTPLTNDYTLHTIPIPGSGNVLSLILNLVKGRLDSVDKYVRVHRVIEAFKHGYGKRSGLADNAFENTVDEVIKQMGEENYVENIISEISDFKTFENNEKYGGAFEHKDHGTSNVAVIDQEGNAITITSTINNVFGAFVRSTKTGIILNDEMDDFSTPGVKNSYGFAPSPINFIKPGKHPMSSMSPSIILDNDGDVRLLVGAAGGSQITTSVALTIIRHLFMGQTLSEAISSKRFHHQLLPMAVQVEKGYYYNDVVSALMERGHTITEIGTTQGFSAVTGISVVNGEVNPVFDIRRGGSAVTTRGSLL